MGKFKWKIGKPTFKQETQLCGFLLRSKKLRREFAVKERWSWKTKSFALAFIFCSEDGLKTVVWLWQMFI